MHLTLATYPSDEALCAQAQRLQAAHDDLCENFTFAQNARTARRAVEDDDAPAILASIEADLRLGSLLARAAHRASLLARDLLGLNPATAQLTPALPPPERGRKPSRR